MRIHLSIGVLLAFLFVPAGCRRADPPVVPTAPSNVVVAAARDQLTWGTRYDARYVKLKYPGGDVPRDRGVCTDVVIRAYRAAGIDLQVLVHEDKLKPGAGYPDYNGRAPDTNIDHRRCPNLIRFFQRHGKTLTTQTDDLTQWKPGDLVFWKLRDGKDHVGVISDVKASDSVPFVIHNIGEPAEEDVLKSWAVVGHYRYPKAGADTLKPAKEPVR